MPEKDPFSYSLITYAWVLLLAALGGAVSFLRKVRTGVVRAVNITEFVGELITSGFAGLITFWLCEFAAISPLISAVMIGISGHMGSRALFMFESWAETRLKAIAQAAGDKP